MQFKVGDLVRVLDRDGVVGRVFEVSDDEITVDNEKDFELLFCDPLNVEFVTEWYDKSVRLPIFMDRADLRYWDYEGRR